MYSDHDRADGVPDTESDGVSYAEPYRLPDTGTDTEPYRLPDAQPDRLPDAFAHQLPHRSRLR